MPTFTLTDERLGELFSYLALTSDDARANGAEDHADEIDELVAHIRDQQGGPDKCMVEHNVLRLAVLLRATSNIVDKDMLCEQTGFELDEVLEIYALADRLWEENRPKDFSEQIDGYIRLGLDNNEILERLDPDTAGDDLLNLVRRRTT